MYIFTHNYMDITTRMIISLHACFFVSCCHQWDPRQSLAEVEALRVRSDMLETDLKTCTSEASEALAPFFCAHVNHELLVN